MHSNICINIANRVNIETEYIFLFDSVNSINILIGKNVDYSLLLLFSRLFLKRQMFLKIKNSRKQNKILSCYLRITKLFRIITTKTKIKTNLEVIPSQNIFKSKTTFKGFLTKHFQIYNNLQRPLDKTVSKWPRSELQAIHVEQKTQF
jgi:hypothetical protein